MCSFPHFSLTCFEILICNLAYDFVLMYYRSSSSVITLHTSGSPCVHTFSGLASYMHWQLSWNLKFDFGFFNAFLLEKYYIKYSFKMFMTGVILVLRYILYHLIKGMCPKICGDIVLLIYFIFECASWTNILQAKEKQRFGSGLLDKYSTIGSKCSRWENM